MTITASPAASRLHHNAYVAKNLEETRGVPDAVVYFLLDQVWVQYRPNVVRLSGEFVKRGLERGGFDG